MPEKFPPKTLIGHMPCPECPDGVRADVKTDKSGNPYRFCPVCCGQYFTRGDAVRVRNLLAKMIPVSADPASPQPASPAAPAASADPAVKASPGGTAASGDARSSAPPTKKRSPFSTLLG